MEKDHCFVITPIGDENDPIRRHIDGIFDAAIKPALEEKYKLIVAHKISEPGSITKQIVTEIYSSKLVIANLTDRNPNVMYELAFRHSLGKPVIMIAEKGTSLPSDIIMERTIFYQNDARGVLDLIKDIQNAESKIDFVKASSPIYDIIHDYDSDAQIIRFSEDQGQDNEQGSEDNTSVLKHILQKLNNLEGTIQSLRVPSLSTGSNDFPRLVEFTFGFTAIDGPCSTNKLLGRLKQASTVDSRVRVIDVHIESTQQYATVYAILSDKINIPSILNFFMKTLNEAGFNGITLIRNR